MTWMRIRMRGWAMLPALILLAVLASPAIAQRVDRGGDSGEYRILQALYGTAQRHVDVTERLRNLARTDRSFRVDNQILGGDPDQGRVKTLRIYAQGAGGNRMFDYREGDVVDGARFSGWSRGDWGHGGRGDRDGWDGDTRGDRRDDRRGERGRSAYRDHRDGLDIIEASYGAGRRTQDVTVRLRSLVRDGRIDIEVSNKTLGTDPPPGVRKSLWVTYASRGRGQQRIRVDEERRLRLP